MTRDVAVAVLGWAVWLSVLSGILWAWTADPLPPSLFTGAAGAAWAIGLYVAWRPGRGGDRRVVPDLSLSSVVLALGLTLLVDGALLGVWLILIGAGVTAIGLAGVARERLAERSAP